MALLVYVPFLWTKPGVISADNKIYLTLDPGRLLRDALYLWDPGTFAGGVPHQGVGYLFPLGPYYWVIHALGIPMWVGQRLWSGTVVFAAGVGVVFLLRMLRWRGPGPWVAAYVYMLSPYFLNYASAFTVIALPWTGLPWLVAFAIGSVRERGWRYPALFALTIQIIGSVNASSLAFAVFGAVLWFPFAVWVNREVTARRAFAALGRIALLTVACSLWWIAGLYCQSRYGINVLNFSETPKAVADASTAPEVLRGLGYWYFYGTDKLTTIVNSSVDYTQDLWLIAASFLLPALALLGGALARFRERAYFVALVFLGAIMAVGAYPWDRPSLIGRVVKWFLTSSQAGSSMRSLPRAVPLVALGLAVLLGGAVTAAHERMRLAGIPQPLRWLRGIDRRVAYGSLALVVLALINMPSLFDGKTVSDGVDQPSAIPSYWKQEAKALGAGHDSRVLELPGSNFSSYRWDGKLNNTVDPITPGLTSRPFLAREQVPYGTPQSADLLRALDEPLQMGTLPPSAVAPIARLFAAGVVGDRNDLAFERYRTARPKAVWHLLNESPGLRSPQAFGPVMPPQTDPRYPMKDEEYFSRLIGLPDAPKLALFPVKDPEPIVHAATGPNVVVAGDGDGLVDAAGAGLISGRELLVYAASYAKDPAKLRRQAGDGAALLVTDTNRRRASRWASLADTQGYTEQAGEKPMVKDPSDQRLVVFPDDTDRDRTVTQQRGGIQAQATDYGNEITYTPEDRAAMAVDGRNDTAWVGGGFGGTAGLALRLTFTRAQHTGRIRLLQPEGKAHNRWITSVKLSFDDGSTVDANLGPESRSGVGQVLTFPSRTFHQVTISVTGDNIGRKPSYKNYSPVGFAEVDVGDRSRHVHELVRLPEDLLGDLGPASRNHPLDLLMTRQRVAPYNAVRSDPELSIRRTWTLPTARAFSLAGLARVNDHAAPWVIDGLLGLPSLEHGGIKVTESRHLPGSTVSRASAAIDGRSSTAWTTGFSTAIDDWAQYQLAKPITVDHFDVAVRADGNHSVPTSLRIDVDGASQTVKLPPVADDPKDPVKHLSVALPKPMRGRTVKFTIAAQRTVTTTDWYSQSPIAMPVAVVDWGVKGLAVKTPAGAVPSTCRTDLLRVDGKPVGISLDGGVGQAADGSGVRVRTCGLDSARGLSLGKGEHVLEAAPGIDTGVDLDQLNLRSAAGGKPGPTGGLLTKAAAGPATKVTANHRTAIDAHVARSDRPTWLVLGQSYNEGWHASANGHDLGPPTLVNGYANGWRVDTSKGPVTVKLRWTPQRAVWIAMVISLIAMLGAIALALWPLRRRLAPMAAEETAMGLDPDASVPRSLSLVRSVRYGGPAPRWTEMAAVTVGAFAIGFVVVSLWAGLAAGAISFACVRWRQARPVVTFGAPACLLICGVYYVGYQLVCSLRVDFGWPMQLGAVHQVAWMAVILLVIDVVVDRVWLRRWWPTDDSPA